MRLVVAIGGNALIRAEDEGTWEQQLANAPAVASEIVALWAAGHELLLTHGNGPQVGMLLLQQELGQAEVPALPLDVLTAMTQGQIGYLLETAIARVDPRVPPPCSSRVCSSIRRPPPCVHPASPSGRSTTRPRRGDWPRNAGGTAATDAGRGWRRMVASPRPSKVLGSDRIRRMLEQGTVVVAGGGGGIPVAYDGHGLAGVQGVIDKDRCSAELALAVDADLLVLLTGVPRVAMDFGTRWEREPWRSPSRMRCAGSRTASSRPGAWGPSSRPRDASSQAAAAAR